MKNRDIAKQHLYKVNFSLNSIWMSCYIEIHQPKTKAALVLLVLEKTPEPKFTP
jgi:hypothetical protein